MVVFYFHKNGLAMIKAGEDQENKDSNVQREVRTLYAKNGDRNAGAFKSRDSKQ